MYSLRGPYSTALEREPVAVVVSYFNDWDLDRRYSTVCVQPLRNTASAVRLRILCRFHGCVIRCDRGCKDELEH